jgi:hypothetical protein
MDPGLVKNNYPPFDRTYKITLEIPKIFGSKFKNNEKRR